MHHERYVLCVLCIINIGNYTSYYMGEGVKLSHKFTIQWHLRWNGRGGYHFSTFRPSIDLNINKILFSCEYNTSLLRETPFLKLYLNVFPTFSWYVLKWFAHYICHKFEDSSISLKGMSGKNCCIQFTNLVGAESTIRLLLQQELQYSILRFISQQLILVIR